MTTAQDSDKNRILETVDFGNSVQLKCYNGILIAASTDAKNPCAVWAGRPVVFLQDRALNRARVAPPLLRHI